MSWARFDDGFARHLKVVTLSDRAFRLHTTAILECCAQLTDGLIAERLAPHLPAAPKGKALQATIQELVDARLWEPVGGGWLIHDWADWNPTAVDVRAKRDAAKERMRRLRDGERSPPVRANRTRTESEQNANEERTTDERSAFVRDPTPIPDPRDPTEKAVAEEPDRSRARRSATGQQQQQGRIPCPTDLCLLDAQVANLELGLGIPRWAIDLMTRELVGKFLADTEHPRTRDAWLKTLSKSISSDWNAGRRPKRPDPNALPPRADRSWITAEEAGLPT